MYWGLTATGLFPSEFADDVLRESGRHQAGFSGVPWGLGLTGVAEKRCGNPDFIEKVGFRVGVKGLAVLAEVEVDTIGATVTDATDRHYVAGIAGHAAVDVRVTF